MIESEQFDHELRNVVPGSCSHLAEETFYRAGWAAAEQSDEAARRQSDHSLRSQSTLRRHPLMTFSAGLITGSLFLAVVLNVANHYGDREESVATSDVSESESGIDGTDSAVVPTLSPQTAKTGPMPVRPPAFGTMSLMIGCIFPQSVFSRDDVVSPANSPSAALSRAARHQWDNLLQTDPIASRHTSEARSDAEEPELPMLQVSPLKNEMNEFL